MPPHRLRRHCQGELLPRCGNAVEGSNSVDRQASPATHRGLPPTTHTSPTAGESDREAASVASFLSPIVLDVVALRLWPHLTLFPIRTSVNGLYCTLVLAQVSHARYVRGRLAMGRRSQGKDRRF